VAQNCTMPAYAYINHQFREDKTLKTHMTNNINRQRKVNSKQ